MRQLLTWSALLMALSVIMGAFGAHGLETKISPLALKTYLTGVHYHQLHAIGLAIIALSIREKQIYKIPWSAKFLMLGILLFSGNCYLYAVTGIKIFAIIVPMGGTAFILGWILWAREILKESKLN
ncbi:MAG: DUF423 domain-containing protein [Bacteriovoracaceae bacterium]|nr:DUF423 domain-containing protein [Bacteriovoracaceae bacterium]